MGSTGQAERRTRSVSVLPLMRCQFVNANDNTPVIATAELTRLAA